VQVSTLIGCLKFRDTGLKSREKLVVTEDADPKRKRSGL